MPSHLPRSVQVSRTVATCSDMPWQHLKLMHLTQQLESVTFTMTVSVTDSLTVLLTVLLTDSWDSPLKQI